MGAPLTADEVLGILQSVQHRPLAATARKFRRPLALVEAIATHYGYPNSLAVAKAAEEMRADPRLCVWPPAPAAPKSPGSPGSPASPASPVATVEPDVAVVETPSKYRQWLSSRSLADPARGRADGDVVELLVEARQVAEVDVRTRVLLRAADTLLDGLRDALEAHRAVAELDTRIAELENELATARADRARVLAI